MTNDSHSWTWVREDPFVSDLADAGRILDGVDVRALTGSASFQLALRATRETPVELESTVETLLTGAVTKYRELQDQGG